MVKKLLKLHEFKHVLKYTPCNLGNTVMQIYFRLNIFTPTTGGVITGITVILRLVFVN